MMGKYWRQHKSKITKEIIEAKESSKPAHEFQLIKPSSVKSNKDWDTFVKGRLTPSFKARSEKFKEMRKNQKFTHTMSRKGYAHLETEMKENHPNPSEITRVEVWKKAYKKKNGEPVNEDAGKIMEELQKCNESKENPPTKDCIRDDALARVLGPEPRGRVRGLGFGATPSRIDAIVQSNARVKELETRMAMFEAKYESILRGKQHNPSENFEDMISSHAATPQVATPQSEQGSRPSQDPPAINQKCQPLHWYNYEYEEVVAEGHIASVDPSTKVHHMPLGRDCWKVWVDIVLNEDVQLYRRTDELRKLGQALGSTVGWPKSSIKMINEELEYLHFDNGN